MSADRSGGGAGRPGRLGAILLCALLAATLAGAIGVYQARTPNLALEVPELDRKLIRGLESAEIVMFVRFDEPDALIEIVGRKQSTVRTLASGFALRSEERVTCSWDGRDEQGGLVPPGRYALRVTLPGQDREMLYPKRIRVVRNRVSVDPDPAGESGCERGDQAGAERTA